MPTDPELTPEALEDARQWLSNRWCVAHPNEGHVRQLAEYGAALRAWLAEAEAELTGFAEHAAAVVEELSQQRPRPTWGQVKLALRMLGDAGDRRAYHKLTARLATARADALHPVAYRVRLSGDDPEEWALMHPKDALDYIERANFETQPLYRSTAALIDQPAAPQPSPEAVARAVIPPPAVYLDYRGHPADSAFPSRPALRIEGLDPTPAGPFVWRYVPAPQPSPKAVARADVFEEMDMGEIDHIQQMSDDDLLAQINGYDPYDVEFARRFRAIRAALAAIIAKAQEGGE